jgi:hypothetical protein
VTIRLVLNFKDSVFIVKILSYITKISIRVQITPKNQIRGAKIDLFKLIYIFCMLMLNRFKNLLAIKFMTIKKITSGKISLKVMVLSLFLVIINFGYLFQISRVCE